MTAIAAVLVCCLLLVPAKAGTSTGRRPVPRPPVALTASPAHVALRGSGRATVRVTDVGASAVVIDVTRAGFALDLRGRPEIVVRASSRAAANWLTLRPRRLALRPGQQGSLTVSSTLPPRAEPGDHDGLILLTSRPVRATGVSVRMRIGVVVVVRAPGTIVRRVEPRSLRLRRATRRMRLLELLLVNRGNVTELLGRRQVEVSLMSGGRIRATLRPEPRELRPHTRGVVQLAYRGSLRGGLIARVRVTAGREAVQRVFRVKL
jgi:hypothetical protein